MEYNPLGPAFCFGLEVVCWKFGGGSKDQTQTTEVKLTPEQQRLAASGTNLIEQFAQNPLTSPDFATVAGFDPLQISGQEQALAAASGGQTDIANIGAQLAQFLSGDVLDPATNPALQSTIDASVRPIFQNLTEQVLPNIRSEAAIAQPFGGSRQGIAEGLASRGASQAAGDVASKIAFGGFERGLSSLEKNLALLPQTSALQLTPGLTTSGVGDVRQAQEQREISDAAQRFNFEQLAGLLQGKELIAAASGLPGGSATTTASVPQVDPLLQLLGLGATAAGTFFGGPAGGAAAGTAFGALSGAEQQAFF